MIKKIKFTDSDNKGYSITTDVNIFSGSTEARHQFTDEVKEWLEVDGNEIEAYRTEAELEADQVAKTRQAALKYLSDTDWKMQRHSDQLLAGSVLSLTSEEVSAILTSRQSARDSI